ncbi:hypothetical protein AFB00_21250 [Pseudonocardia sp. HH130630-07]|nr:hypothetical protein AFB00_21250 [Pseudonocardia sp. HH130630-07]
MLAGLMIVLGLAGIVLPVLPGPLLIVGGVAVWAIPRGDSVGWWVLGIAVAVTVLGQVAKYLLPGRRLKASGVPTRTLLAGLVLGVVGFFVVPVVGLFLGFVLGVWLAELVRLPDSATAWRSAREALAAVGWSILIELAAGMLATAVWIGGLVVG